LLETSPIGAKFPLQCTCCAENAGAQKDHAGWFRNGRGCRSDVHSGRHGQQIIVTGKDARKECGCTGGARKKLWVSKIKLTAAHSSGERGDVKIEGLWRLSNAVEVIGNILESRNKKPYMCSLPEKNPAKT